MNASKNYTKSLSIAFLFTVVVPEYVVLESDDAAWQHCFGEKANSFSPKFFFVILSSRGVCVCAEKGDTHFIYAN